MRRTVIGGKAYRSVRAACLALGVDYARARAISRAYLRAASDPALAVEWARSGVPGGERRTKEGARDRRLAAQRAAWSRDAAAGRGFVPHRAAPCRRQGSIDNSHCEGCPRPYGCVEWRNGHWDRRVRCRAAVDAARKGAAWLAALHGNRGTE